MTLQAALPSGPRAFSANRSQARSTSTGRDATINLVLILVGLAVALAHLTLARDEFGLDVRALLVVPLLPLLWEARRALLGLEDRGIPANAVGLLTYYVTFSAPAFFRIHFTAGDRISFTEQARQGGALAVAVGALALYAGMRAGEWLGRRARPTLWRIVPPARVPEGFDTAVKLYVAGCSGLAAIQMASGGLPTSIANVLACTLTLPLAVGLAAPSPDIPGHPAFKRLPLVILAVCATQSLLSSMLSGVLYAGLATVAAGWAFGRRLSVRIVAVLVAAYLVLQPAKMALRARFQQSGTEQTDTARFQMWVDVVGDYWTDDRKRSDSTANASLGRLAELDTVIHAFDMIPRTVKFLDGEGWRFLPLSWIPRLVWPDKPTSDDTFDRRYGVIFGRQSKETARTTAITCPILVDGYWNFGWPGIVIGCGLLGAWVGIVQMGFAGKNWALRAMATAAVGQLVVTVSLQTAFGGLLQIVVGQLAALWGIHFLAGALSQRRAAPGSQFVSLRLNETRHSRR